jgi:primosomal protein N' (replication factor Y) (superfamily II helicase)
MLVNTEIKYASVILPIKFREEILYLIPADISNSINNSSNIHSALMDKQERDTSGGKNIQAQTKQTKTSETQYQKATQLQIGSRVKVTFANKSYTAVVKRLVTPKENNNQINYKEIDSLLPLSPVAPKQIKLWEEIADYYMCTVGEVYKAAYTTSATAHESVRCRKSPENYFQKLAEEERKSEEAKPIETKTKSYFNLPELSEYQKRTYKEISHYFNIEGSSDYGKPVLLHGATGSGKTEVYITLAAQALEQGKNVLYMVPEIAISKQLNSRLKKHFKERLLVFHSKQTSAEKAFIHKVVSYGTEERRNLNGGKTPMGVIVLGTRSSLLLPFDNLGLIIVDEEHDISYKQTEPAPRYNARDTAIMLARIYHTNILLGSATPSFETIYNCTAGRYEKVEMPEKYFGASEPEIEVIDTIWARKSGQMRGNFSQKLINEIKRTVAKGRQVLVFRNRRSYAPIVECSECGSIPKCPHCNVYLSYHKYNNTLRCHYCDYTVKFNNICPSCGKNTLTYKGSGTEKIEEELKTLLPEARIERFDADVSKSKRREESIIREFSRGEIDILVGTQMLSKGFDFDNLHLVAVLGADSIIGIQDFRGDERAVQLFTQLMGRTGRRSEKGKLIIQTSQKEHTVYKILKGPTTENESLLSGLLNERREYNFAPFVRMIKITVRHRDITKVDKICNQIVALKIKCKELTGPFTPPIDKVRGEWLKCFYVKFSRDKSLKENKTALLDSIESLRKPNNIIFDVDPL